MKKKKSHLALILGIITTILISFSACTENAAEAPEIRVEVTTPLTEEALFYDGVKVYIGNQSIPPAEVSGYKLIATGSELQQIEFLSSTTSFKNISLNQGNWNFEIYVMLEDKSEWLLDKAESYVNLNTSVISLSRTPRSTGTTPSTTMITTHFSGEKIATGEIKETINETLDNHYRFYFEDTFDRQFLQFYLFAYGYETLPNKVDYEVFAYRCMNGTFEHDVEIERYTDNCGAWSEAHCKVCGRTFVCYEKQKQVHELDTSSPIAHAPGCSSLGYIEYRCKKCGRTVIDKTSYSSNLGGHDFPDWIFPEATQCGSHKYTFSNTCVRCSETIYANTTVFKEHSWPKIPYVTLSCSEEIPTIEQHCLNCLDTRIVQKEFERNPHTWNKDISIGAYICSNCNKQMAIGDEGIHGGIITTVRSTYLDGWRYEEILEGNSFRY